MKKNLFQAILIFNFLLISRASLSKEKMKISETPSLQEIQKKDKEKIPFEQGMKEAAEIYLLMQAELTKDSFKSFPKLTLKLQDLAERFDMSKIIGEHAKHYEGIPGKIIAESKNLGKAENIKEARGSFKLLSQAFSMWASMANPESLQLVYCPMAKASWLQAAGTEVSNPYLTNMPSCGNIIGKKKEKKTTHNH